MIYSSATRGRARSAQILRTWVSTHFPALPDARVQRQVKKIVRMKRPLLGYIACGKHLKKAGRLSSLHEQRTLSI